MYYILVVLLFLVTYIAVARFLSSVAKGCVIAAFVFVFLVLAVILVRSMKNPVRLFNQYEIRNFKIERINN